MLYQIVLFSSLLCFRVYRLIFVLDSSLQTPPPPLILRIVLEIQLDLRKYITVSVCIDSHYFFEGNNVAMEIDIFPSVD
jgi:hypothetical protein